MTLNVAIDGARYFASILARAVKGQENSELVVVVEKFADEFVAFTNKFGVNHQFVYIEDLMVTIN
jgi:hypothetical protein